MLNNTVVPILIIGAVHTNCIKSNVNSHVRKIAECVVRKPDSFLIRRVGVANSRRSQKADTLSLMHSHGALGRERGHITTAQTTLEESIATFVNRVVTYPPPTGVTSHLVIGSLLSLIEYYCFGMRVFKL